MRWKVTLPSRYPKHIGHCSERFLQTLKFSSSHRTVCSILPPPVWTVSRLNTSIMVDIYLFDTYVKKFTSFEARRGCRKQSSCTPQSWAHGLLYTGHMP